MPAARRVVVEIEVPEGTTLEELLRGVRYRVLEDKLWEKLVRVRRKHVAALGGPSSEEEYRSLEEELWEEEQ